MTSIFSSVFNELQKEKENSDFKTKDQGTFALAGEHRVLDLNPLGMISSQRHWKYSPERKSSS